MLRRRHRHERQAALFGVLITTLIVVALGAFAIFTDAIPAPFARDFTTAAPEAGQLTAAPPCPPEGTLPVAYQDVQVNVLNATRRAGLATETANALTARGFLVLTTGNSTTAPSGAAQINFGTTGLGAAYTLAAQIEGATLVFDQRVDATVDLIVGAEFAVLLDPTTILLDPAVALAGVDGCVPLADAVPAPAPVPAVTDAPAAAAG